MYTYMLKPTSQALVRRSCRVSKMNQYGRYDVFIDVRCKVKNPRTGRMVFMDGKIEKSTTNQQRNDLFRQNEEVF